MWWLFGKVNEEKAKKARTKCKMYQTAYANCVRAYTHNNTSTSSSSSSSDSSVLETTKGKPSASDACDTLRNQVLHCFSSVHCIDVASEYERCYHLAVSRGRYLADKETRVKQCHKQVKKMEKCLRRAKDMPV